MRYMRLASRTIGNETKGKAVEKLYTCVSEEYAANNANWKKRLVDELNRAEECLDTLDIIIADVSDYSIVNDGTIYEDTRDDVFAEEKFAKSGSMEFLKREVGVAKSLFTELLRKIESIHDIVEDAEVEYSEELAEWYTEKHKYDYERA